jgi:membrane glycosyltransferase
VQYFLPGLRSLPHWPQFRGGEIDALLVLTVVVLLLPKALGALLALRDRSLLRQYGGAARLGAGLIIEQLFSMMLAPSMMLFHSAFVVQTLCGRSVSWNAQERSDRGVTLREAWRRQWWHVLVGVAWGALMWALAPQFFWWLTPVLLGLISSVWLTAWTSRTSAGRFLRRRGLLLTPEESAPPTELLTVQRLACAAAPAPPPQLPPRPAAGGGLRPVYQGARRKWR